MIATATTQVHQVYIKASPERIWEAITQPEWNQRYGYSAPGEFDLHPGGAYRSTPSAEMRTFAAEQGFPMPDVIVDGEVIESDPPRKLVQTWRMTMTHELASAAFTRLTSDIEPVRGGVINPTVPHDVTGAPIWAGVLRGESESSGAGGGWSEILSGLKTLLETGKQLPFQSGPA